MSTNVTVVFRRKSLSKNRPVSTKDDRPATNQVYTGIPPQVFELSFYTSGIRNIIAIHSSEVRSAARGDRLIQSLREPELQAIGVDPDSSVCISKLSSNR